MSAAAQAQLIARASALYAAACMQGWWGASNATSEEYWRALTIHAQRRAAEDAERARRAASGETWRDWVSGWPDQCPHCGVRPVWAYQCFCHVGLP